MLHAAWKSQDLRELQDTAGGASNAAALLAPLTAIRVGPATCR